MQREPHALPPFDAPYAEADDDIARRLLQRPSLAASQEQRVDATAGRLIAAIRERTGGLGSVEDLLHEYSFSTAEGLALMVLAEALLRVPDAATADRFIEDKLRHADFLHHESRSGALLVNASTWALAAASFVLQPNDMVLARLAKRIGLPAIRTATRQAMRIMGNHFVLGQTIEAALARAADDPSFRYSFDMLGEGARTADDARRYFALYTDAIAAIGRSAGDRALPDRPGISVKLSALHPRYEAVSRERVLSELVPSVLELARHAKRFDLNFTLDAEEADRLELSLDVIAQVFGDPSLAGWDGFGLAIQAYQKRAQHVIDYVAGLASRANRRMMVRLVKGAYWDTEVKRAQERGLADYPVFTRKAMTDLNYVACAQQLLALGPCLYPQFATHNALTVATILEQTRTGEYGYEFQRLHGMGEALYAELAQLAPDVACRTYAPVGTHKDLLAYLVRRLLENGANSSFVSLASNPDVTQEDLLRRPADIVARAEAARSPHIPLPRNLYGAARLNSQGVEFGSRAALSELIKDVRRHSAAEAGAAPIVNGQIIDGPRRTVTSPIDGRAIGTVIDATEQIADRAAAAAQAAFIRWSETPVETRAAALEAAANLLSARMPGFVALLQTEGGKTLDDAVSEVREAVDFCRYYAAEARAKFGRGESLPGPTGESNYLRLRGRGVFVAISPWNFPLAIFLGQVAAALVAGNTVVAKPAEQTPLIVCEAVRLLHEAGIAPQALQLVTGDGAIGARLVSNAAVAGVVFTGSTEVARLINRSLAAKDGPIATLIAETGGINAMIVDATALPEQTADDAVTSAFRSAGQRCSALRLLLVQEDVADHVIGLIAGAARELKLADPRDPSVHIGPVIDGAAKARLEAHIAAMKRAARVHYAGIAPESGMFVAPHIFEIGSVRELKEEVFGPILHVVRYAADRSEAVLADLEANGYGLTLGVQTRIDSFAERVAKLRVGNVYVNRNMIGAVVGVQPFGGQGLSGTGPKAGGPHYLPRFATEQTVTVNTAAAGGNTALMAHKD